MAPKKKTSEEVAEELAGLALRNLSTFSEEEQEQRILVAEQRVRAR